MKCRYDSVDVIHRIGLTPLIRIWFRLDFSDDFKQDYPLVVLSPRYTVYFYEVSKDLKSRTPKGLVDQGTMGSAFLSRPTSTTLRTHIDIPASQQLINLINEAVRRNMLPAFDVLLEDQVLYYEHAVPRLHSFSTHIVKPVYGSDEPLIVFTSDEVDLLMRKLKHVEMLRVEVPVPLKAEHVAQEKLVKSVSELMAAKDLLIRGDYDGVLRTCRNIIMNYLTKREDRRKLADEISDYILVQVPEGQRNLYETVIGSIGTVLYGLLQHLHKFIKEDTGKLIQNPLRADAEYAFYTLFSVVRYMVELVIER